MNIDQELVNKKLAILDDYISQIENMDFGKDDLLDKTDLQQLLAFRLQQAVGTAIGIATHLIAALGLSRQDSARDVFKELYLKSWQIIWD